MIKNLLSDDDPGSQVETNSESTRAEHAPDDNSVLNLFDSHDQGASEKPADRVAAGQWESQSADETIRQSGLAYSAGIAFFAAVVFMLILGWGADVLLGSSPWGIVGGIVIGSIIGFVQFFRITSQIFRK
jgi:F0F1-type ATP synthase assembly protein I